MLKLSVVMITTALLSSPVAAELSIDQLPDIPTPKAAQFDPQEYFCDQYASEPKTYQDAYKWLEFIRALSLGEITPAPATCYTPTIGALQRGVWENAEDFHALAGMVSLVSLQLSGRERYDMQPEHRFANDAVALGYMVLGCKRFPEDRLGCIERTTSYLPQILIGSSPVFCDFVKQGVLVTEKLERYKDYSEILLQLPGSCSGIIHPEVNDLEQKKQNWWLRLSRFMMILEPQ